MFPRTSFVNNRGGRNRCYRFYEEWMLCVKEHGIQTHLPNCVHNVEDYKECLWDEKKRERIADFMEQKQKLKKEGKWPPKKD